MAIYLAHRIGITSTGHAKSQAGQIHQSQIPFAFTSGTTMKKLLVAATLAVETMLYVLERR